MTRTHPPSPGAVRSIPSSAALALLLAAFAGSLIPGTASRAAAAAADSTTTPGSKPPAAPPRVVINEVMYHPPDDRDEFQWVELWNPGSTAVDLQGWSFKKGLKFGFTNATPLAPGAFLVVSRDKVAFAARYGTNVPVVGDFDGRLSHGGEQIELTDREGRTVDRVRYDDAPPWPASADGQSPSLERILAAGPGDDPANWAPSEMPPVRRPAGSPGKANAAARTNSPPRIADVRFAPPKAGQPLQVSAVVDDPDGVQEAQLVYRVLPPAGAPGNNPPRNGNAPRPGPPATPPTGSAATTIPDEVTIPMKVDGARQTASIPAQPEGTLVRFRIRAVDRTGTEATAPHPSESRPAWTAHFGNLPGESRIPRVSLLQRGPAESAGPNLRTAFGGPQGRRPTPRTAPARGESTVVYQAPGAPHPEVFDFVRIVPRQGGWKVRFAKDQPLDRMSTVNVVFEGQPRFVLAEHLAYEAFRAAGHPAPLSGHWRIAYNGRPLGYHLFVEQPNSAFLRRSGLDDAGDLYKILWYGQDLISQHEKKNNPASGHTLLVDTVESLRKTAGPSQWKLIEERFDVAACANYYAVSHCIQNWDGFFNNHFVLRSPGPAGRWTILPWDEDKTWGDYDGVSPAYDWYSMPLTYGMNGDKVPRSFVGGGIHGGPAWWRRGGWFSGPLLANPQFRERFLARLSELCRTAFTPEAFEPILAGLEQRLEPEVRFRASALAGRSVPTNGWTDSGEFQQTDPDAAAAQFHRHMNSFRNQVKNRREFLVRELAKAGVK